MSLTEDKTKDNKDTKEPESKINKFIDNELTRTYYQNFHLQNYSSKLYDENQKLYHEQDIIKDTNISLQNNIYEKEEWFKVMPENMFKILEEKLGWHLCINCNK